MDKDAYVKLLVYMIVIIIRRIVIDKAKRKRVR
jgi:hypothetical protein